MMAEQPPANRPPQPPGPYPATSFGARLQQSPNRPKEPKRVRNGLRLDLPEIPPGTTDRSIAWLRLFSTVAKPHVFEQGIDYARRGQTASLDITPGQIFARVQGTEPRPHAVKIGLSRMSEDAWNRLISVLSEQSRLIAQILSGRLPSRVDRLVQTFGTPLIPDRLPDLSVSCTCLSAPAVAREQSNADDVPLCKHIVAVALLVAQELERTPLTACTLRGMEAAHLVERLRLHRTTALTGASVESVPPLDPPEAHEAPEPLEAHLEDFWTLSDEIDTLAHQPEAPVVPHTLLRRLGPSPMADRSKFPIVGLLATCYDLVTEHILEIQQQAMGEEEGEGEGEGEGEVEGEVEGEEVV